ncbi:MAG: HAMP domain-containing protein [Nitrospira sp.]|nr:HAMP domain-containing protein [Nitrospira sp.]
MKLSIRWKVALGSLLAVTCGLAIAGLLAMQSLEQQEISQLNDILDARSNLVEYSLQPAFAAPPSPGQQTHLRDIVRQLGARALARVTVVAADGTVIADSAVDDAGLAAVENHLSRPEIQQALATGQGRDIRASQTTGSRTMYRAIRTELRDGGRPVILRLGLPMTMLEEETAKLQRHLAIAIGAAFLIALLLSLWMARSITKPLSDIADAARRLSAGDATIRIHTHSHDEVGLLGETLNHMTDQLRTKIDELSEDRAQLLAMLTSMVEGVMVLDCRGRILQVNPALERMFDVRRTEIRGQISTEVLAHPELNSLITTILANRAGQEAEITLTPGGRCLHIETSVAGCERENEACAVLVFHDITELRRLEKIRKDFVANVSHELRTPLTSIKGYVEALLDGGKDNPETAVNFLAIILKQSDRLNLILEDLLELSKIESGRVSFKEDPLDIRSLIERTLSMIKPLADKKGHRLISNIDGQIPPIAGDESRLAQVLTNLLDNAVKYTPEQGTITVTAKSLPDQTVELAVTDTGLGIPEQDRPRVFERFYRVDKARSREMGGTGLGLAIVKHIVEGHGGQVWVEAHPPQGSRFLVRLPITRQARSAAHTMDDKIQ